MSDGISAAWDDALHYEQLCKQYNEEIRYKGPGPWPYNMDSKHYEQLKARKAPQDNDITVTTHEWRYSDSSSYDSVCVVCGCTDRSQQAKMPCAGARVEEPAIRLVRPMQMEYMTIGMILTTYGNNIYKMSEDQFLHECMTQSNGSMNPQRVKAIYQQLRQEAGI